MPIIPFSYGKTELLADLPDSRFLGALYSGLHGARPAKPPAALIQDALSRPVGAPRLADLCRGKRRVVILASDHTRPVPSRLLAPPMLDEIRRGNPDAEITFLIATGCHRPTTQAELRAKFGEEIFARETIVVHDCDDEENLRAIGTLPSGGKLVINRLAAEADLLLSEGFIEPHFFAGFSGGRKSVMPGIASRETVLYNHNAAFLADPHARTGVLSGNPVHEDMRYAAKAAKLAFCVNVVLNAAREPVFAAAGAPEAVHDLGCGYLRDRCAVRAVPADIVITSNGGYPLDRDIYQSVKGMSAAETTIRPGGVIIMLAECGDGHGGQSFYDAFRLAPDVRRLTARILATDPAHTEVDQWQAQIFARILQRADVVFVSAAPDAMVRDLHMLPAHSIPEALALADRLLAGRGIQNGGILAIPDGVSVIVNA
ncbi:MAG: nickel-dependent lactate racemase [Oscillospiraceae bacterium]|nr:nickel-dependent lactate racemase [Oscillospiraceae bacterium]